MGSRIRAFIKILDRLFQKKLIVLAFFAAVTVLVYCNSFNAPFTLDDYGSIVNNDAIRNPLNFIELWKFYSNRIVLYFTFALNYAVHDTGLAGYHITNVLLHAFNGFLVFLLLKEILGLKYFAYKLAGRYTNVIAAAAALIFVCHPLQINAVTYIVQRTAALAATFYFLAVYFYIRYRKYDKTGSFLLTLLFTLLAMFTKENTITIPFMLIIIELMFFMKDGKTRWWKRLIIIFVLLLTVPIIPGTNLWLKGYSQSDPGVSFKASTSMDRFQYFYTEMNVILLYIKLLFVPTWQNFDYSNDYPMSKTIWDNNSYISLLILAAIGIYGLSRFRKNKLISLGIIWFFVGLAVESSFISIKDVYFEHRLYFPVAGFAFFLIGLLFSEKSRFKKKYSLKCRFSSSQVALRDHHISYLLKGIKIVKPVLRRPLIPNTIAVFTAFTFIGVIYLSYFTLARNYVYSDSIRLWSDTVKKAPKSDRAHSVLASSYMDAYEGDKSKKKEYLDIAIKEFLISIDLYYNNSTAHCNLSKAYLLKKDYKKCIDEAQRTISIQKSEYAYHNMGLAYKEMGDNQKAIEAFLKGYEVNSKRTFILKSLANTYYDMGEWKNAKKYYEEFLKINIYSDNKEVRKKIEDIDKKLKDGT